MKDILGDILKRFKGSKANYMKIDFGWRKFIEFEKKAKGNISYTNTSSQNCCETGSLELGEESNIEVVSRYVGKFWQKKESLKAGVAVCKGEILGTIELMGIAHEMVVPENGIIEEVNIKNGDVVEYGQILFKIKEEIA